LLDTPQVCPSFHTCSEKSLLNTHLSIGEIAAAFAAGRITSEDAIIAAYYRGYVNGLNAREGAMLAVGLSATDGIEEIRGLGLEGRVQAGCHNSPENVTLTGDADAIEIVAASLHERGIFCRKLRTGGKAYHSHHMHSLGPRLEELLRDAECCTRAPDTSNSKVQFLSTVTATFKDTGFDGQYWRKNMESPVLFSESIQYLLSDRNTALLEIGPHSALELPIRQISANMGLSREQTLYSPAVRRGRDNAWCILDLMGWLYLHSHHIPFEKVNSIRSSIVRMIPDLPPYQWKHDKALWREPRASSEFRFRRQPHHELLGSRMPAGDGRNVQWRNKLQVENFSWLAGHKLESTVIYPAAGYLAMAVEAAVQVNAVFPAESQFEICLRNVEIHSALMLNEDEVEIFTILRPNSRNPNDDPEEWIFEILSIQDGLSVVNCTGSVSLHSRHNVSLKSKIMSEGLDHKSMPTHACYSRLSQAGLVFESNFQSLENISVSTHLGICYARSEIVVNKLQNIQKTAEGIHPVAIDALLQTGIMADSKGSVSQLRGAVPVFIESAVFQVVSPSERQAIRTVKATTEEVRHGKMLLSAELLDSSGKVYVRLAGVKMTQYIPVLPPEPISERQPICRVVWKQHSLSFWGILSASKGSTDPWSRVVMLNPKEIGINLTDEINWASIISNINFIHPQMVILELCDTLESMERLWRTRAEATFPPCSYFIGYFPPDDQIQIIHFDTQLSISQFDLKPLTAHQRPRFDFVLLPRVRYRLPSIP
jgi:acyl transferase domain-containing protein